MKNELIHEFKEHDKKNTGNITIANWCESMKSVTTLNLPWRTMRQKLVKGYSSDLTMVSHLADKIHKIVCTCISLLHNHLITK